ncbi:hypothetical protein [Erwinia sorbitola]|uniref:Uncharacterized protein n=1 Tax=Erwinia sorbitola TaxID=2681984 RepID=A0A6I6ES51_9GAMM|nr:hypothetical protein [Erwinia sorbitola]QGU89066.1 hypothetical protein GN242_18365 [Erwinia sorbitola]
MKKPSLISIVTPTFISTLMALGTIWLYLNRMGRLDVFLESITFKDLFVVVAMFLVCSVCMICLIFYIPSLLISLIIKKDNEVFYNYQKIKDNFIRLSVIIHLLAIMVFFMAVWLIEAKKFSSWKVFTIAVSGMLFISLFSGYFFNRKAVSEVLRFKNKKTKREGYRTFFCLIPSALFLVSFLYACPLSLIFGKLQLPDHAGEIKVMIYAAFTSIIVIIFALFPVAVYLREKITAALPVRIVKIIAAALTGLFCMSWIITSIPILIIHATMKLSGVADYQIHTFLVQDKDYPVELLDKTQWKLALLQNRDRYVIHGVKMYSFGDIRLICPVNVLEVYKKSMNFRPGDRQYDQQLNDALIAAAQDCIPFNKSEVKSLPSR